MVASRAAGELERNQVEDELRLAKEKAEESDKLKSAFLANMSHEIRTPMNGILGFAGLLKTPNLTGEQQKQYLSVIEKSGLRMLNIINEIIDISKIESGQMKLSVTETNINEQIEFIYAFFKHEVEAKGMTLSFRNDLPFSEAFITTDCEKLYSILTNLVKNAIKYSNVGSIEFGYFLTHQQDRNEAGLVNEPFKSELQFYVKDTGIGIPVNRQKAIFERFVQADIIDVNARQGAGLGLTITKAFVEMLGGRIWVDSEEEKGSTFYFTLPYNVQQNGKENNQITNINEVKENQNNKLKILIAEDDDDSCQLISIGVRNFGKEIITVQTGADAVDVCRNNPDIDLVLMDIQMPGMSGYEATRQIRLFNKNVIIIAQTAYALSGDKEKAFSSGCNDYISKPIRMDELLALVQKYSNKKIV